MMRMVLNCGKVSPTMIQHANDGCAGESKHVGKNIAAEYRAASIERYKCLLPMDLGLKAADEGAHSLTYSTRVTQV